MRLSTVAAGVILVVAGGCGGAATLSSDDTAVANAAALSVDVAADGAGLLRAAVDGLAKVGPQSTGADAAAASTGATALFLPAGCATSAAKGNVVTYTLTDCTGPFGLAHLTGVVTATYTPRLGGTVDVVIASTGFQVDYATVNLAAQAAAQTTTVGTSLTVHSTSSGSNKLAAVTHTGDYTATWDTSCLRLDGTFMTTVGGAGWSTVIAGFRQCAGMCPDAGGTVTVTSARQTVTVHYTDGGTAEVTSSSGDRAMIALACSGA